MSDSLSTYLHDHLAGSHFAVNLLETMREHYPDDPLGPFAASLLEEVKRDQDILQEVVDRVGSGHWDMREAAGWLAEKASRLKLRHDDERGLGTFEALEVLALGILGKRALWRALSEIAEFDERVRRLPFTKLIERAEIQHDVVEKYRLEVARSAFRVVEQVEHQ